MSAESQRWLKWFFAITYVIVAGISLSHNISLTIKFAHSQMHKHLITYIWSGSTIGLLLSALILYFLYRSAVKTNFSFSRSRK
jgi:hypothetical protein